LLLELIPLRGELIALAFIILSLLILERTRSLDLRIEPASRDRIIPMESIVTLTADNHA
jgi:hypothetical protein